MTLLPEFRDQLLGAAHQRAHGRRYRVLSRVQLGRHVRRVGVTIPALLSVTVSVGIAIVAIATLGHGHRASVAGTAQASSRQGLVQILGVLRRPQTKADLFSARPRGEGGALPGFLRLSTSRACSGRNRFLAPCMLKLDKPLIRTARAGGGYLVAIFPTTARPTATAQRGEGVVITLRGPGIYLAASGPQPTSVQALRAEGLLLSSFVNGGVNRGVILVPDGVSKVTLDHFRLLAPTAVRLDQLSQTTAAVSDNVTVFEVSGLTEENLHLNPQALGRYFSQGSGRGCQISFGIYELPATAQMSWLNPAGNTIRRTTINLRLYVGTHQPAPGTTSQIPGCTQ